MRRLPSPTKILLVATALVSGLAVPTVAAASSAAPEQRAGAAAGYSTTHFGDGNLPAGCIVDRDQFNPDNECFHAKVGLNALDTPEINVAVLVPVSPTAERDMRIVRQSVEMMDGGIDHLARQMEMDWLADGVNLNVTTKLVPVDANGFPTQAVNLVKPKIVVIATNPVGGVGIGINPTDFMGEVGFTDGQGLPCGSISNPFSMDAWHEREGFDGHHGELGGYYVARCDGAGGQVCFSVNGAVDPVPGTTDFFSLYDLVSHENGHCLTLGHVGDGAEGAWGALPSNDIMAYSSDPVDHAKCVSTLNVEAFAIEMSQFLDTNGDGKVDEKDPLEPNDKAGDGRNSFQVQNPKDHWYASSTGKAEDCPQPDWGLVPGAPETDWQPKTVPTTTPQLDVDAMWKSGQVSWNGTASWVSTEEAPTATSVELTDKTGDGTLSTTDITALTASTNEETVEATLTVEKLWPTTDGGRINGYSLYVGGRKFDSFVITQGASSEVQTIDSGARYIMPPGTSTWDTEANTVSFSIPRDYLAKHRIEAPYDVFGATGVHIRTKDWVTSLDRIPDTGKAGLAAPPMAGGGPTDAPMAEESSTQTTELEHEDGNTFTPEDTSTYGFPLVPVVGTVHQFPLPIEEQATAELTLTWDDPSSYLNLEVKGGSSAESTRKGQSVTVTVPWAKRELDVKVIPSEVGSESVNYTLTATLTTLTANADGDGVPDVADVCKDAAGPINAGGCPDTDGDGVQDRFDTCPAAAGRRADGCPAANDERVVAYLDGKEVSTTDLMTRHGGQDFNGSAKAKKGSTLELVWMDGDTVIDRVSQSVSAR